MDSLENRFLGVLTEMVRVIKGRKKLITDNSLFYYNFTLIKSFMGKVLVYHTFWQIQQNLGPIWKFFLFFLITLREAHLFLCSFKEAPLFSFKVFEAPSGCPDLGGLEKEYENSKSTRD